MGNPRRYFEHLRPLFVTNRLAQGLPLVPNDFINRILSGILARAQERTPSIAICDWNFLQNHYHGIIVPRGNPADVASFMNYIDGEIAKAVKALLGIPYNVKVWAQRYHAAILVDPQAVINKLAYIALNPVAAEFVEKAEDWYGVGYFDPSFCDQTHQCKYVPPSKLPVMPNRDLTPELLHRLRADYEQSEGSEHELKITPLAWLEFFDCYCDLQLNADEVKGLILKAVRDTEKEVRARRGGALPYPSKKAVSRQNPHKHYIPQRTGRRVFCICTDPQLRKEFVEIYQHFCRTCERIWKQWTEGNFEEAYPPGAFVPSRGIFANILPAPI
jgi:REP element-mobilizing transposase RayT